MALISLQPWQKRDLWLRVMTEAFGLALICLDLRTEAESRK